MPVRIARFRCSPSWGWCSSIRAIAWRTARVTATRARSEADAARRSRPPRPRARDSSRTRKSRSASACAARSVSPRARACSMSSSISARRRRYASLCVRVEDLARVAESRRREVGALGARDLRSPAGFGGNEVQHVELPAGGRKEPREVPHALEVSHAHGAPLEHERPVVALATKEVEVSHQTARHAPSSSSTCAVGCAVCPAPIRSRTGPAAWSSKLA